MPVEHLRLVGAGIPPVGRGTLPGHLYLLDDRFHHPCVKDECQDLEHHPAHATRRGQSSHGEKGEHDVYVFGLFLRYI